MKNKVQICNCVFKSPTYPVFRENLHFSDCPLFRRRVVRVALSEIEEMAFASGYYDKEQGTLDK